MKRFLFIIVISLLALSCKEKSKIEIIPNYDAIYLYGNKLDLQPELKTPENTASKEFEKIVSSNSFNKEGNTYYHFEATLYLNENGKAEKIKFTETNSGDKINPDFKKLKQKLVDFFEALEFSPGIKNGKPVKAQWSFEAEFAVTEDGKIDFVFDFGKNSASFLSEKEFDKNTYFVRVEEMPAPIGGFQSIAEKVVYPESAKNDGLEGRVFIKAYIDSVGNVVRAEVIKGLRYDCDKAALNAVKNVKFTPGMQAGKPVNTQVAIPIIFRLK